MTAESFPDLTALAQHLREKLETKKFILLYAYNGTGKTRLSVAFKDFGKKGASHNDDFTETRLDVDPLDGGPLTPDTLYFNAFTEDLFYWDNDLKNDRERVLKINRDSQFFVGLGELEMDNRIRPLLNRYANFEFEIDTNKWEICFALENRKKKDDDTYETERSENIKISRGEENIFIWCFFLAIAQLALDGAEAYKWVKYIYIDDPISSLDEHNAITVANHLAQLLKRQDSKIKTVISTHHTLFFNVLSNELGNARKYFMSKNPTGDGYLLREETSDTPFFHHVAALSDLYHAAQENRLFTHHFNMLRTILEKTASFHGYKNFSACIKQIENDSEGVLHARIINILSHGNYSLYEPQQMLDENKVYFKKILYDFINRYPFNPELFHQVDEKVEEP